MNYCIYVSMCVCIFAQTSFASLLPCFLLAEEQPAATKAEDMDVIQNDDINHLSLLE